MAWFRILKYMDPATLFIELIKEYRRLVAELRAEIVRLSAHAKEQEERLAEALDTIRLLKRRLYSASRERYIADPPGQQCLFDTVELGGGPPPEAADQGCPLNEVRSSRVH